MDDVLERIAASSPEDELELLRVYADQLILRGDPLGELIVVASDPRETPELARRKDALIAARTRVITEALGRPRRTELRWRRGFIDAVELQHAGDERLELALPALADHPEARLLRRIEIESVEYDGRGDLGPVFAELARLAPRFPRLTEIAIREGAAIGDPWVDGPIALGNVSVLYAAYPALEILELGGRDAELGAIALPRLCRFVATWLQGPDIRTIVNAQLPALAELEITWRLRRVDNVPALWGPLLHREFPTLQELCLEMGTAEDQAWLIDELPTAPLARKIRRLAFRRAFTLNDGCFERLCAHPYYRGLDRLELPAQRIPAALQKQLRRLLGDALALF